MRIQIFIKLVVVIIVFTVLACTLIILNKHLKGVGSDSSEIVREIESLVPQVENVDEEEELAQIMKRLKQSNSPEIVLGLPAFDKARRMLEAENFQEARKFLEEIVVNYEGTPSEIEAYRVLGEMNMDDLFEVKPGDGKIEYKVKRGDSYLAITSTFKTNLDLIKQLNGVTRIDQLRPGNKLIIMPLNYSLRIYPFKNQMFLMSGSGEGTKVIKLYEPIFEMTLSKKGKTTETSIERVIAYYKGKRVNSTHDNYRESDKTIKMQNPNFEIRAESDDIPRGFCGIILSRADIEELALILRSSNNVEVIY